MRVDRLRLRVRAVGGGWRGGGAHCSGAVPCCSGLPKDLKNPEWPGFRTDGPTNGWGRRGPRSPGAVWVSDGQTDVRASWLWAASRGAGVAVQIS
jgi:hypothetical protein